METMEEMSMQVLSYETLEPVYKTTLGAVRQFTPGWLDDGQPYPGKEHLAVDSALTDETPVEFFAVNGQTLLLTGLVDEFPDFDRAVLESDASQILEIVSNISSVE